MRALATAAHASQTIAPCLRPKHAQLTVRWSAAGRWRLIALTNNFSKTDAAVIGDGPPPGLKDRFPAFTTAQAELEFLGWHEGAVPPRVVELFDDFCDSSTLGMRSVFCHSSGRSPFVAFLLTSLSLRTPFF